MYVVLHLQVLQYNVPGGKKSRALAVVHAFKALAPREQITEENLRLARIVGWCSELVCNYFIVFYATNDINKCSIRGVQLS